ncbi:SPOR domain-containing protein [Metabacillus fastidiosus]|uniref:SPOR domain-containing protein n=1 Tax=Metabacillus fastidiosus TaxID=1458 RepID=UPI002E218DEE|nr:SPOR domain-containing protein [Metabacillus fastidiosus]
MDKQSSDKIKIKINGKESNDSLNAKEKLPSKEAGETPFLDWNEKIKAEEEIASTNQDKEKEDEFNWLLPDEDDIFKEDPKVVLDKNKSKKKKQPVIHSKITSFQQTSNRNHPTFPVKQFIMITILAIITGVSFSYIGLNLFSNEEMPEMANVPSSTEGIEEEKPPQNKKKEGLASDNEKKAPATTAELNIYAVQVGKFSSKQGAETAINDLKTKGFPAAIFEENGSFFVFAGLGKEKAETEKLSGFVKEAGIDAWGGKSISPKLNINKEPEKWTEVIESLTSITAKSINGENVNTAEIEKVETQISNFGSEEKEKKGYLEKAVSLLKGSNSEENGWKAQQELLNIISK